MQMKNPFFAVTFVINPVALLLRFSFDDAATLGISMIEIRSHGRGGQGANIPFSAEAEPIPHEKNVLIIPNFIANTNRCRSTRVKRAMTDRRCGPIG